jgi:para-nitrobenzyl esterase
MTATAPTECRGGWTARASASSWTPASPAQCCTPPMDVLSMASDDMGWWVANDFDRFDPHTVDRITDEVTGWRIPRSRAKKIVDTHDQGSRTPAEVRASLLTDYIFGLPAARCARHRDVRPGTAGRSVEQAERDTRVRDLVLDFVTGEQARLWPAVTDRPTSESVGKPPFEAAAHYQAALALWENIDRP